MITPACFGLRGDRLEPFDDGGAQLGVLHEVAQHAQRQERDFHVHRHHRVDAVAEHLRHGRPLGERLGVEAGHGERADLEAGVAGRVEKLLANLRGRRAGCRTCRARRALPMSTSTPSAPMSLVHLNAPSFCRLRIIQSQTPIL